MPFPVVPLVLFFLSCLLFFGDFVPYSYNRLLGNLRFYEWALVKWVLVCTHIRASFLPACCLSSVRTYLVRGGRIFECLLYSTFGGFGVCSALSVSLSYRVISDDVVSRRPPSPCHIEKALQSCIGPFELCCLSSACRVKGI